MLNFCDVRLATVAIIIAGCHFLRASCAIIEQAKDITAGVTGYIETFGFPDSSNTGIFFALGLPVDIPEKTVLFSIYFEANYPLPSEWNSSYYDDGFYSRQRRFDRRFAYDLILNKLKTFGFAAEACLCKMICETAKRPLTENGIVGDVLQVILTPSSSEPEDLPSHFLDAEFADDCEDTYEDCPISPLALISHYEDEDID